MTRIFIGSAALASALLVAPATFAQTTQGGSASGTNPDHNVSASTSGYGASTIADDTRAAEIGGTADANAVEGGAATTRADAQVNDQRARMRASASASDDDERARSDTRTMVLPNGMVRSMSKSRYQAQGEKPERDMQMTVTRPDGTTTTKDK